MSSLKLSLACGAYDRTRALADGSVAPEGVELSCVHLHPRPMFDRMLRSREFDVSEMSLVYHIIVAAKGDSPFVGIPVMLSRTFRHGCVYVRTDAGIQTPEDLRGKRIGVPDYAQTAAVYVKGLLQHDYGVRPEDVRWYQRAPEGMPQGALVPFSLPDRIRLEPLPAGGSLEDLLEAGELDAIATTYLPQPFLRGSPRVRRLFPNFKDVERDYYLRTGIFPIMHVVVIRRELHQQHPWLAARLYDAFTQAKALAQASLYNSETLKVTLPWLVDHVEESRAVFGPDPWPYGIQPNLPTLEAITRFAFEQGITPRKVAVEELFAPGLGA